MPKYSQYDIPKSEILIDFSVGQPCNSLLGLELVKDSLKVVNETEFLNTEEILQYSNSRGLTDFRKNLSNWINIKLNNKTNYDENNLMILDGITGSIRTILESTYFPDDVILVEEATYFIMIDIFKDCGLKVEYIPINDNGIDFERLSDKLLHLSEVQDKVFLYMIPFFHNPLGKNINLEEINMFKNIFDMYDNFYVLSDEVYYFLNFDKKINDELILPLAGYHKNFISIGSFSKIIGPSLRLGYVLSNNDDFLSEIDCNSNLRSSGGNCVFSSIIVNSMFEDNKLDNHLETIINNLKNRHDCMINELKNANKELEKYGFNFEYTEPNGGYFVLVKLKSCTKINFKTVSKIIDFIQDECKINKVSFLIGDKYTCSNNDNLIGSFRLSFSYYNKENIKIGINRIVNTLKNIYKVRVVTFGNDKNMSKLIKDKLDSFDCIEYYIELNSDCSNLEDVKISKYNKTIFINLTKCDKINMLMRKILDNLYELDDNSKFFESNLMLITNNECNFDNDISLEYSKFNPILLVESYSKNYSVYKNVGKMFDKLSKQYSLNINNEDIEAVTKGTSYSLQLPGLGVIELKVKDDIYCNDDTNIENYIFSILGRNKGIYNYDYTDNNMEIYINELLDKRYMILKDGENHKFSDYISNILLSEDKFYRKVDTILLESKDENNKSLKNKECQKYSIEILSNSNKLENSHLLSFSNYLCKKYYSTNRNTNSNLEFDIDSLKMNPNRVMIIDDLIFFKSGKSIDINYDSTIDKIKEITNEYMFLDVVEIRIVNTSKIVTIIECKCNLNDIDKCILSFIKNLIKEVVPKNFNIIFLNIINDHEVNIIDFENININNIFSAFHFITKKISVSTNEQKLVIHQKNDKENTESEQLPIYSEDIICNLLNYNEEKVSEKLLSFILRIIKSDKYVGISNSNFREEKFIL